MAECSTSFHIPSLLLTEIFEQSDAYNRLRLRRVCQEWNYIGSSQQLITKGIFVDFDHFYSRETDFTAQIGALVGDKGWKDQDKLNILEAKLMSLALWLGQLVIPATVKTLCIRIGQPLRAFHRLILKKRFCAVSLGLIAGNCLLELLSKSQATRVVLYDCVLLDTVDLVELKHYWAEIEARMQAEMGNPGGNNKRRSILHLTWAPLQADKLILRNCHILITLPESNNSTVSDVRSLVLSLDEYHRHSPGRQVRNACAWRPQWLSL